MTERKPLAGRVALVTGASRGLGAAAAARLTAAGAHTVLLARTVGGLEETDDAVRAAGGEATLCPVDLTAPGDLERALAALAARFGRLDILVSCAAALGTLGPAHQIADEAWRRVLDTNLTAAMRLIRATDPLLRRAPAGRAVFAAGYPAARAYWGPYAASKAALEALALAWAAETARTALRVNLLDPGPMRTRLRAAAYPGEDPATLPPPDEAAARILRLVSPDCAAHGQVFRS
ncbi:MAG: SDR family NAD(P)-dependent oxidoreductase [Alphaproteobacteria bacterium]|nr:SDR family NAD(P)-dependent oxidoreductase [Alphaproteobacteria bacterium]